MYEAGRCDLRQAPPGSHTRTEFGQLTAFKDECLGRRRRSIAPNFRSASQEIALLRAVVHPEGFLPDLFDRVAVFFGCIETMPPLIEFIH